jgi:cobalt-precorrin 5A hydrolase
VTVGIVTLSSEGLVIAHALKASLLNAEIYAHQSLQKSARSPRPVFFDRILDISMSLFRLHDAIIYITPCGVAARAIASVIDHKTRDPAVVVIDAGGRYAVSLLSGHEGGANQLAIAAANAIGAEPVISTTTEATKNIIVGIGCRRNTPEEALVNAITSSLEKLSLTIDAVRLLATADIKQSEAGLIAAAKALDVPLLFVSSQQIRTFGSAFEISAPALKNVNLPAVAEPACMLAGHCTSLIMRKTKCNGITIAMARENCLWSA